MRISDWSSDVRSSDLPYRFLIFFLEPIITHGDNFTFLIELLKFIKQTKDGMEPAQDGTTTIAMMASTTSSIRSEERRVGKSVSVRVDLGGRRIIKHKTHRTVHNHVDIKKNRQL